MLDWRAYIDRTFNIPYNDGPRPDTRGVIVHSTRGGWPVGVEYIKVIDYFTTPGHPNAHLEIAQDGRITVFMAFDLIAWHALDPANLHYLGVELEQPFPETPYTEIQYQLLASWTLEQSATFGFPLDRQHVIGHEEEANGILQRKTDPGRLFDWNYEVGLWTPPPICGGLVPCADGSCPPCQEPTLLPVLGVGLLLAGGYLIAREQRWL